MSVRPSRQKRKANFITRVEGPVSLETPVLNTQVDPYIDPVHPYIDPEMHFYLEEHDTEDYFYRWVLYNDLSNTQKKSLPADIYREVLRFVHELDLGQHFKPNHYPPEIVIGQNIHDPRDLICALHNNPLTLDQHHGISPACEFENPYTEEPDTNEPVYRWVLFDQLSQKQQESLPIKIIVRVSKFQGQLRDGMCHLTDSWTPEIVIGQNIHKKTDLKRELHYNFKHHSQHDGISPASEFIYPYHDENGPLNEGNTPAVETLNRWAGGPPEQLSPMSPEELEWCIAQIPPNRRKRRTTPN